MDDKPAKKKKSKKKPKKSLIVRAGFTLFKLKQRLKGIFARS